MKAKKGGKVNITRIEEGGEVVLDFSFSDEEEGGKVSGVISEAIARGDIQAPVVITGVAPLEFGLCATPEKSEGLLQRVEEVLGQNPRTSQFQRIVQGR